MNKQLPDNAVMPGRNLCLGIRWFSVANRNPKAACVNLRFIFREFLFLSFLEYAAAELDGSTLRSFFLKSFLFFFSFIVGIRVGLSISIGSFAVDNFVSIELSSLVPSSL